VESALPEPEAYYVNYDPENFQLEQHEFEALEREYGPFDLDGAATPRGSNSFCDDWCSKEDDFCSTDVAGRRLWLNAPFRSLRKFLLHYTSCKERAPATTSALIIVPRRPEEPWWKLLEGMEEVRRWPAGTQLFTLPGKSFGDARRRLRACPFEVCAFWDPARSSSADPSEAKATMGEALEEDLTSEKPYVFILDSGASQHMTPWRDLYIDFTPGSMIDGMPRSVKLADDRRVPVEGCGTIELKSIVEGVEHTVRLTNVLYVPAFAQSLVSLGAIMDAGGSVVFRNNRCIISKDGVNVLTAARPRKTWIHRWIKPHNSSLFLLSNVEPVIPEEHAAMACIAKETPELWHKRYGHLSYRGLADVTKKVAGITTPAKEFLQKTEDGGVCGDCMAGKQTRAPRPASQHPRATRPLRRLYADLCGPFQTTSIGGARYYLLVTDEATRYSMLQPIKTKDDAGEHLMDIINYMEAIAGVKTQFIRTDRGGEFINEELEELLRERGVHHEKTVAYSPESNGVAERGNRTIMERVRSMLHGAGLPNKFWGEAAVYANLLKNLSPTAGCDKTPWEMMHGYQPNVSGLRAFGSLVYVHIPDQLRRKLDKKTTTAMLVGYDLRAGHYRVYINDTVRTVKDITVDETKLGWTDPAAALDLEPDLELLYQPSAGGQPEAAGGQPEAAGGQPEAAGGLPVEQDPEGAVHAHAHMQAGGQHINTPAQQPARPSTAPEAPHMWIHNPVFEEEPVPEPDNRERDHHDVDDHDHGSEEEEPAPPGVTPAPAPRRNPARERHQPDWYQPAFGNQATAATAGATSPPIKDPITVHEAMTSPQAQEWRLAMQEEMDALTSNGTWELEPTPAGATVLPCKWVFKTKTHADGSVERFKARLVVGGHRQKEGIDYSEVYAPVSRYSTLRMLLSKVASEDLELHSLDISNAFLNGDIDKPVYMKQPEGFTSGNPKLSCRLKKTLYGLKQAPKQWYLVLSKQLAALGFTPSDNDPALWIKEATKTTPAVYILLWVDDLLMACANLQYLEATKKAILAAFKGRDLGEATRYLNISIMRNRQNRTISIHQPTHVRAALERFNLEEAKEKAAPMAPGVDYSDYSEEGDKPLEPSVPYAECIGALLYIANCTRPDLSTSVSLLARHMSRPSQRHWQQAKNIIRYLKGTESVGITFGESRLALVGWTDSDFAQCKDTRRSRSGFVFTSFGGAVSWQSKLQSVIALSTAESEYIAASHAAREAVWLKRIATDLSVDVGQETVLHADNQSAIHMIGNGAVSSRTKHIDVVYHFIRNIVARGMILMKYCSTDLNCADMFTKPLASDRLAKLMAMIGVK
jgi:hypothetical protein